MEKEKLAVAVLGALMMIAFGIVFYKFFIVPKSFIQECPLDNATGAQKCQINIFSKKCSDCLPQECPFMGKKQNCTLQDGKPGVQECIEFQGFGKAWSECKLRECEYIGEERECVLPDSSIGVQVCRSAFGIGSKWGPCIKTI